MNTEKEEIRPRERKNKECEMDLISFSRDLCCICDDDDVDDENSRGKQMVGGCKLNSFPFCLVSLVHQLRCSSSHRSYTIQRSWNSIDVGHHLHLQHRSS